MTVASADHGVDRQEQTGARVWDLPLRLFHWLFAGGVTAAWGLGKFGPDVMTLHFWFGYAVLALIAFRLVWGFLGSKTARFSSFIFGPKALLAYMSKLPKRNASNWHGHNPLGGLFVFLLLGVIAAQAALGLFADPEDYINVGPLASWVGIDGARTALAWHGILARATLILVILHVSAILFYRLWKREDLVTPMITGRRKS
ncbi:cytochrome b/b6 domain-containing protein [Pseudovibrio sp. Tun.PSC04-5.I4]|uniref:cytochrome b/b6 domain-containing protein n=1 Tax=Pseudovibrio sp. Tun.PSC04-5.I4 TaxID=1798213 RepID=UPI00088D79ED|nr:cytochrome b/b6 domain-containing protein [Pseudovibrio sp. Tun.PSC04-5.I4]SDR47659.1 Cytochrome b [Pseudovibrio sp. Tun.PSC04-5.I4]